MARWVRKPINSAEAAKILREVTSLPPDLFYELSPTMRRAAFTMGQIHDAAVLNRIKRQITLYMRQGWDEAVFADWLETNAVKWNRSYSKLVFRNATQNAYNVSRFRVHMRPDFVRRYPALVYDAVMDTETSQFCEEHNGRWWWRRDFPLHLYPPNHHNCRSVIRAVAEKTTKRRGWAKRQTVGAPMGTSPWPGHPPAGWQSALERRLKILEGGLT
jgi:hypothetical protein